MGLFGRRVDKEAVRRAETLIEEAKALEKALSERYEKYKWELFNEFEGHKMSLKEVEKGAIRHIWDEARKAVEQNREELSKAYHEAMVKFRKDIAETKSQINGLKSELAEANKGLKEAEAEIRKLKKEISGVEIKLQKLSAGPSSQKAKIDALNSRVGKLEGRLEALEAELKALREENRELREFVEASLREMREMKRQIEILVGR